MSNISPGNDPVMTVKAQQMSDALAALNSAVVAINSAMASIMKLVVGAVIKAGAFPVAKSGIVGAVTAGALVVYLTADETPGGAALFPNGNIYLDTLMLRGDDEVDSPFSYGKPVLSNGNKTLTIPVKKSSGITVALLSLTLLGAPTAATGSVIKAIVYGD